MDKKQLITFIEHCNSAMDLYNKKELILNHLKDKPKKVKKEIKGGDI